MTEANTVWHMEQGRLRRRCMMCLDSYRKGYTRRHRKYPYREGYCDKGLHRMTVDNTIDRGEKGLVCRQCCRDWSRLVRAEGRSRRVHCAVRYCPHVSSRSVDRTDPFFCRDHRAA